MAVSGLGVLLSGLGGTRPTLTPYKYPFKTEVYQIPYLDGDLSHKKMSATDENRQVRIIENQLVGISRAHSNIDGYVVMDGVFTEKHNYPANNLIIAVSGIEASINNIYIGGFAQEYSWSGLSHVGTNYLWLSLVEYNPFNNSQLVFRSSRQFRDFETRSTTSLTKPVGPENSILVATFISGTGITQNPPQKNKLLLPIDHVEDNQNPHGTKWFQDAILCSGITIINPYFWGVNSGNLSGLQFNNIKYRNDVTIQQFTTLTCSGILGNIHSGNLSGTFFTAIKDIEADPATIGNLIIASGTSNISGLSFIRFRNIIDVSSGITTDGLDLSQIVPLVTQTVQSGNTALHTHSFISSSGMWISTYPKYPGSILVPNEVGKRADKTWEYNTDLGLHIPTLRHKSFGNQGFLYIRNFMPEYYNAVESIEIEYKVDSGSSLAANPITVAVRDTLGTLLTPRIGNVLSSSGIGTILVSGFAQTGMSRNMPWDLEITLPGVSGTSQYLGHIKYNYRINKVLS